MGLKDRGKDCIYNRNKKDIILKCVKFHIKCLKSVWRKLENAWKTQIRLEKIDNSCSWSRRFNIIIMSIISLVCTFNAIWIQILKSILFGAKWISLKFICKK